MSKIDLLNQQIHKENRVTSVAYLASVDPVDQAHEWSDEMVRRDLRGPGDVDNAMRRVARRIGVAYSLLWNLRYRKPKDIPTRQYLKLWCAWETLKDNQMRALKDDYARTIAESGYGHNSLASAASVLGARRSAIEAPVADAVDRKV